MLLAVALFAAMDAAMKSLTPYYSAMQIACLRGALAWPLVVFWLMTLLSLGAGVLALPDWQPLRSELWVSFVLIGITGFGGQIAITQAFKVAPAALIAPFEYTALLWGIGFDIVLWQLYPQFSTLAGAAVIMLSGLYLLWQHRR